MSSPFDQEMAAAVLTPAREAVRRLRRSLWGIPESEAVRLLTEQEERFIAQVSELTRQIEAERREQNRLRAEIERNRRRVHGLKEALASLSKRWVEEREKRALASRLMEEEMHRMEADHAAQIHDLKFEEVRISAELHRHQEGLRALVTSLTQAIDGIRLSPEQIGLPEERRAPADPDPEWEPAAAKWQGFLTGKISGRTLAGPDGEVIVREGDQISPSVVNAAAEAGRLTDLLLAVRLS